jgi:hypothetical protein
LLSFPAWVNAQVAVPPSQGQAVVDVGSLTACGSPPCDILNYDDNPGGGATAAYGGASGQATDSLGAGPAVSAIAISVASTQAHASASVTYYFEVEANGSPGAPPLYQGSSVPFTILANANSTTTYDPFFTGTGYSTAGGQITGGSLATMYGNCFNTVAGCQLSTFGDAQPNTATPVTIDVNCDVYGLGSCQTYLDPQITLDPAYAPYYDVVLNSDVAPVPLPAAVWLLLSGLGGLGAVARRKNTA